MQANIAAPARVSRPANRAIENGFLLLAALLPRLLVAGLVLRQHPPIWLFTRGTEMGLLATSLLRGEGLSSPFGGHTGPSALIGPLYPLLVAWLFHLFGSFSLGAEIALLALQVLVSVVNVWLVMLLAERLGGRRAGLFAGLLWALSPPLLWMPSIFWETTFATCALTALLLLALRLLHNPSRRGLVVLSALAAVAALLTPAFALTSLALLSLVALRMPQPRRHLLLAMATFVLVFSPWPVRNALALHAFVPLRTTVGLELWMGNHDGATGHLEESLFPLFNPAQLAEYQRLGEVQFDREKAALARAWIVAHPGAFLSLTLRRAFRFWFGTGSRGGSWVYALHAALTTLLGLCGLAWLYARHRLQALALLLPLLLFPLPYYITHAEFRYRLMIDPLLTALAAVAVVCVARGEAAAWFARLRCLAVSLRPRWPRLVTEESGQTVVIAAVCLTVLVAFLGLAIDVGHLRYERRHLQLAADAAALSAALELGTCGTADACSAMQTAAQKALAENGYSGSTTVLACATTKVSGLELMLNNPACANGSSDPNAGNRNYVEVVLSEHEPTYFAQIVGFTNVPIVVHSEATRAPAPCIWALDQRPLLSLPSLNSPPLNNGITVVGAASIKANCPIVDESSTLLDFNCALGSVAATQIRITGGNSLDLLCPVSPTPQFYSPIPTPYDPLAYLPKPALPASCTGNPTLGLTTLYINSTATLSPGRYCGGISIGPLANVTFNPGTYVLSNTGIGALGLSIPLTGGLTIAAGATIYGNGVTFYNQGTNLLPTGGITIAANVAPISNIQLIAPTSGTYAGILFMQDPNNTAPAVIAASAAFNTKLEGALYFPMAPVTYAVAGNARFNILVAYDINFGVISGGNTAYENSVFGNDYSSLPNGSPITPTGAVLAQ